MLRPDGPRDRAAASPLQVLPCRQLDFRRIIQEFFLHPVVKFLPAVVREGRDVIENQAAVLGVELRRPLRVPSAPSRAEPLDALPKPPPARRLLLPPSANQPHHPPS